MCILDQLRVRGDTSGSEAFTPLFAVTHVQLRTGSCSLLEFDIEFANDSLEDFRSPVI